MKTIFRATLAAQFFNPKWKSPSFLAKLSNNIELCQIMAFDFIVLFYEL